MKEIQIKGGVMLADDDFDMPKAYLRVDRGGYVLAATYSHKENRCSKHKYQIVHRIIAGAKRGETVDHINGNKLDNRRANLRICTQSQNMWNRKTAGCTRLKSGKYRAQIKVNGRQVYLGTFSTADAASTAYQLAHRKYRGEFSPYQEVEG